jgi:purine catabolism regulator
VLRVAELCREILPPGALLFGGSAGLDAEVSWPVRLRSRPPAFGQLKGGEVALIGLATLQQLDPQLRLARVIHELHRAGVSAIVVNGEPPHDARAAADESGIPLIAVPAETVLSDLERTIVQALLERRTDTQRRARELERELMELAIDGQGVPAIVARLAQALRRGAWVITPDGQPIAGVGARGTAVALAAPIARQLAHDAHERLRRSRLLAADPPVLPLALGGDAFLVAPIVQEGQPSAFLALDGTGQPSPLDRAAVARAAAACAVVVSRSLAVLAAQREQDEPPMLSVLDEDVPPEVAASRAARADLDLTRAWAACVVTGAEGQALDPGVATALQAAVTPESIWAWRDGAAVGLLAPEIADAQALLATVRAALDGQHVRLGLGRPYVGVAGLRRSYREATWALRLGSSVGEGGMATAFATLGVHRLLCAPDQAADIEAFCAALLGTLQQHDATQGSELVRTLDVYLRSGGSPTETAARLGLHRNTVLYRLQRIVAITGLDLDNAERRLELYLALRATEVLRALGGIDGGRRTADGGSTEG